MLFSSDMRDVRTYLMREHTSISKGATKGNLISSAIIEVWKMLLRDRTNTELEGMLKSLVVTHVNNERELRGAWPSAAPLSLRV